MEYAHDQPDGKIDENQSAALIKDTIHVLNLNAKLLIEKRKAVWKEAEDAWAEDEIISKCIETEDNLGVLHRTRELLQNEMVQNYHLCVVYRAYYLAKM